MHSGQVRNRSWPSSRHRGAKFASNYDRKSPTTRWCRPMKEPSCEMAHLHVPIHSRSCVQRRVRATNSQSRKMPPCVLPWCGSGSRCLRSGISRSTVSIRQLSSWCCGQTACAPPATSCCLPSPCMQEHLQAARTECRHAERRRPVYGQALPVDCGRGTACVGPAWDRLA